MWWILLLVVIMLLVYYILMIPMKYWEKRGVKQGSPLPIFGHTLKTLIRVQCFPDLVRDAYNITSHKRYCGIYQFFSPILVIRDPDLIKQIGVKDFDHFGDHSTFFPEEYEPLWGKNLFALTGQRWKHMRAILSPAFTSSKMRQMFVLISNNAEQFTNYFLKQNTTSVIKVEMMDIFTRFTNDVIASSAFGVRVNSLEKRDNEFYRMGCDVTDFTSLRKLLIFFGYLAIPKLMGLLKFRMFSKEARSFFLQLVKDTISTRTKNNTVRPDMLNLLMEARKHDIKQTEDSSSNDQDAGFATIQESAIDQPTNIEDVELTDEDITAQALIFFFAGFDSVAQLMCHTAYELAIHTDIQDRLCDEIDEAFSQSDGKLTYEVMSKMEYLDMVISESLRKWPNAVLTDRICTKPYTIQPIDESEQPLRIEKNMILWIPTFGMHRDPKYFPNPECFDPERFNMENRKNIHPYAYTPFGVGPRNCIGQRFALLETKALLCHLLAHFHIVPVKETQIPLKLSKQAFLNLIPEGKFWVGLQMRSNNDKKNI